MGDEAVLFGVGSSYFFSLILFSGSVCIAMPPKKNAPGADDVDVGLEQFLKSLDFPAPIPGSNDGWRNLLLDILTYALLRVFRVRVSVRRPNLVFDLQRA